MVEIKKKSVLITGAGKRIGRAIALDLAAQGWGVAVHYFTSKNDADHVVAEIARRGGRAAAIHANLGFEAETADLVPAAVEQVGPLTALINNASVFERDEIDSADRRSWDRHMETNLRAPLVLSQAFARQLPPEERGCIVNILDQRVWNLTPHFISYTLSKAGLWTLTQTLAMALAPRIRVNGIGPGPTLPSPRQSAQQFLDRCRKMPLRRGTSPDEIAAALRFILAASAMTGQMIALDGGEHLGWAQPGQGEVVE